MTGELGVGMQLSIILTMGWKKYVSNLLPGPERSTAVAVVENVINEHVSGSSSLTYSARWLALRRKLLLTGQGSKPLGLSRSTC